MVTQKQYEARERYWEKQCHALAWKYADLLVELERADNKDEKNNIIRFDPWFNAHL